jgi:hypothetical protein
MARDSVVVPEPTEGGKPLDYERQTINGATVYGAIVHPSPGDTGRAGQVTSVGTTAVQVAAVSTTVRGVLVQASYANTARGYVGFAASQPYELEPGESIGIPIDDVSKVWVRAAAAGQTFNWIAIDVA